MPIRLSLSARASRPTDTLKMPRSRYTWALDAWTFLAWAGPPHANPSSMIRRQRGNRRHDFMDVLSCGTGQGRFVLAHRSVICPPSFGFAAGVAGAAAPSGSISAGESFAARLTAVD